MELSQQLETHSQLIFTMLVTMATLGNLFKQFDKVAKHWQPLAMMATHWQCTGNVLAIIGDRGWWQSPATIGSHHVASIISASVNGALVY